MSTLSIIFTIALALGAAIVALNLPDTKRGKVTWAIAFTVTGLLAVVCGVEAQRDADKKTDIAQQKLTDLQTGQQHIGSTTDQSEGRLRQMGSDLDKAKAENERLQLAIENVAQLSASCPDTLKLVLLLSRSDSQIISDAKLLDLRLSSLANQAGHGWLDRLDDRKLRVGSAGGHPDQQEAVRQKFARDMDAFWDEIGSDLKPSLNEARVREAEILARLPRFHDDAEETPEARALLESGELKGTDIQKLKAVQDLATYMTKLTKVLADQDAKPGSPPFKVEP